MAPTLPERLPAESEPRRRNPQMAGPSGWMLRPAALARSGATCTPTMLPLREGMTSMETSGQPTASKINGFMENRPFDSQPRQWPMLVSLASEAYL